MITNTSCTCKQNLQPITEFNSADFLPAKQTATLSDMEIDKILSQGGVVLKNRQAFKPVTKYNIDYYKPTGSRQLPLETFDGRKIFVSFYSLGNNKLGKNILIVDTLAGNKSTCGFICSGCYALDSQKRYPQTYNLRLANTYLANLEPETYQEYVWHALEKERPQYCRPFTSGDFATSSITNTWIAASNHFTKTTFYGYTKQFQFINPLEEIGRFNIVRSGEFYGGKFYKNFGNEEYIKWFKSTFPYFHICPAVNKDGKAFKKNGKYLIKCGISCTYCMHHKHLLIYEH